MEFFTPIEVLHQRIADRHPPLKVKVLRLLKKLARKA